MSILVTDGAGTLGSVTIEAVEARGREAGGLDDPSTGHAAAPPPDVARVTAGVGNGDAVKRVPRERGVTGALHVAARSSPAERPAGAGWQPRHPKLEETIVSAAAWMDRCPEGDGRPGKGAP